MILELVHLKTKFDALCNFCYKNLPDSKTIKKFDDYVMEFEDEYTELISEFEKFLMILVGVDNKTHPEFSSVSAKLTNSTEN